jgi:hypothetical protein
MKKLLFVVLLASIAAPVYAGKNTKASPKSKTLKPKLAQQQQSIKPADNPASNNDTTWHGSGNHTEYGMRELDPRVGRYMHVAPAPPAKQ